MKLKARNIIIFSLAFMLSGCPGSMYSADSQKKKQEKDIRNIENYFGIIPDDQYADQGYVVVAPDGTWVSVLTTGTSTELGFKYVVSSYSKTQGKTWSEMQPIDPSFVSTAWAIPYITPSGRIYAFYTRNRKYCFKYTDDNGKTWSKQRYEIPVRWTNVDDKNDLTDGKQYFWGVSKPFSLKGSMYFSFTKFAKKNMDYGEGWLFKSSNINTEKDPSKIIFEMLPEGLDGIKNPAFGPVQEEHTMVPLSNGDLYMNFRTKNGYIGCSYSRDGGKTWTLPQYATYADGHRIKNSRACPQLFHVANGQYLLWMHNTAKVHYWNYRNPAWVSAGVEEKGIIQWSDPEILLYSNDTTMKMSYPDMININNSYWFTETQKTICRVHKLSDSLFKNAWKQSSLNTIAKNGIILQTSATSSSKEIKLDNLPGLKNGAFTIDMWIESAQLQSGEIILDNRDNSGKGFWISVDSTSSVCFNMQQGSLSQKWSADTNTIKANQGPQHIVFVVDGAPNIITVIVNGKFNDGGNNRKQGWCWFDKNFNQLNTSEMLKLKPSFNGNIVELRIYNRYLTTSEAIGNYHSGKSHMYNNNLSINF